MTDEQKTALKQLVRSKLPDAPGVIGPDDFWGTFDAVIDAFDTDTDTLQQNINNKKFRFEQYTPGTWQVGEFAITADKKKIFTPKGNIGNSTVEPSAENQFWRLVFEDSGENPVDVVEAGNLDAVTSNAVFGFPSVFLKGLGGYGPNRILSTDNSGNIIWAVATVAPEQPPANTAPTITLLGANPLTLTAGESYAEPGYTATDAEEGDLSADVVVTGAVDTTTVGTYTKTYTVTDAGGLTATATRTVQVTDADNTPPTAPTNVTISNIEDTTATLTWAAATDN